MVRRMIQDAELRLAGGGGLTNVGGFTGGGYVGGGFGGGFAGGGVGGYTTR